MHLSELEFYPRFVFNCSDGKCFSTSDLTMLNFINRHNSTDNVDEFRTGALIDILWEDSLEAKKTYRIKSIDIRDIRYDSNEKLYGIHSDDCSHAHGRPRFNLMSLFIFLEAVNK